MVYTHSSCVFVEVQWLECSYGVYILDGWFARAFIQKNENKEMKCSLLSEECEGR